MNVRKIATHREPHPDEYEALRMLQQHGEAQFPGVATAPIKYVDAGHQTPDGRTAAEHEAEGTLAVGIWGSRFDEHPGPDQERKKGECATTLVAAALGLDADPALAKLHAAIARHDLKAQGDASGFGAIIRAMHHAGMPPEQVKDWAFAVLAALEAMLRSEYDALTASAVALAALEPSAEPSPAMTRVMRAVSWKPDEGVAKVLQLPTIIQALLRRESAESVVAFLQPALAALYGEQVEFYRVAAQKDALTETYEIAGPRGETLKLSVIRSDSPTAANVARSERNGNGADVTLVVRSTGNVALFTNQRLRLDLDDVIALLRLAEDQYRGRDNHYRWSMLTEDGTLHNTPEWYYQHDAHMILNGSRTAQNVPPTAIPPERVLRCIRFGLDPTQFYPAYAERCRRSICVSSRERPCPLYPVGLRRCRVVRNTMRQQQQHASRARTV